MKAGYWLISKKTGAWVGEQRAVRMAPELGSYLENDGERFQKQDNKKARPGAGPDGLPWSQVPDLSIRELGSI